MKRPDFRQDVKRFGIDVVYYIAGSLLYAVSVNCFSVPNHIAPGGVTGVATMIHYALPTAPIGLTILILNIPLLVAAWLCISRTFTVRTLLCTALSTVVIDTLTPLLPIYKGDMFLVSVMGGVLSGVGLGLIFLRGGSTGGTEIAARLLERRFPYVPVGRLILTVDAVVIVVSAFVFNNVENAMYAVVLTFVASTLIDALVYGGAGGKLVLIFSKQQEKITAAVLQTIHRGVTKLRSRGGYTGEDSEVLLCAVRRTQVYPLRQLVAKIDPAAFIVITSAEEVLGNGFATIE
ncbi:MAG: YitT family protein [Clostridia bacterium]|nr:YitT family protein [Clostridia bacterium]